MRIFAVLFAGLCAGALFAADGDALIAPAPQTPELIKSVRLDGSAVPIKFATRAGDKLDPATLSKDVHALWVSDRFTDIRVQTTPSAGGTAVVFKVTEKPTLFLRDLKIEPNSFGIQPLLATGTALDPYRAQQVAILVRRKLQEHGYMDPNVDPELVPVGKNKADLLIHVKPGDQVRVKKIEIVGETVFKPKEVERALQAVRVKRLFPGIPGIWKGIIIHPAYSEEALQSDLARIQSYYFSRGYFDSRIRIDDRSVEGEDATIRVYVQAGPRYLVNQWEMSGKGLEAKAGTPKYGLFQTQDLCTCLINARREAEKQGIVDFTAHVNMHPVENSVSPNPLVNLTAEVEEGKPYSINRIELRGLTHYSEATVRRNLLLDEGDLLDQTLLRRSVARLNQTQMFETLDETQVVINSHEKNGTADIIIPLHERKRGMWNFSGPVGPVSFAGPLQANIASRLPPWGRGMFELSTYYLTFSAIGFGGPLTKLIPGTLTKQGIIPVLSLFRPFTPGEGWKSGILIAPQLGWTATAYTYGTTQIASRLIPIVAGTYHRQPNFALTFDRPNGDGVLLCEQKKPRLHLVRSGTAMVLQFIAGAPGMM